MISSSITHTNDPLYFSFLHPPNPSFFLQKLEHEHLSSLGVRVDYLGPRSCAGFILPHETTAFYLMVIGPSCLGFEQSAPT